MPNNTCRLKQDAWAPEAAIGNGAAEEGMAPGAAERCSTLAPSRTAARTAPPRPAAPHPWKAQHRQTIPRTECQRPPPPCCKFRPHPLMRSETVVFETRLTHQRSQALSAHPPSNRPLPHTDRAQCPSPPPLLAAPSLPPPTPPAPIPTMSARATFAARPHLARVENRPAAPRAARNTCCMWCD